MFKMSFKPYFKIRVEDKNGPVFLFTFKWLSDNSITTLFFITLDFKMFLIWINLIHANSALLTGESEVQVTVVE